MARLRRHWSKTCEPCCSSAQRSQRFSLRNSGRIYTTTTVAIFITEASTDFHDVQDVLSDCCLSISSKSQELRREMDHHCEAITETYRQLASLNGHKAASHSRFEMVRDETRVTHLFHRCIGSFQFLRTQEKLGMLSWTCGMPGRHCIVRRPMSLG